MLDSREELGGWFDAPKRLPNCITLGRARVARAGERSPAPAAVCRPAAHDTSSAKTHSENRIINYFVGRAWISAVGVSSVVGWGRLGRACALRPPLSLDRGRRRLGFGWLVLRPLARARARARSGAALLSPCAWLCSRPAPCAWGRLALRLSVVTLCSSSNLLLVEMVVSALSGLGAPLGGRGPDTTERVALLCRAETPAAASFPL